MRFLYGCLSTLFLLIILLGGSGAYLFYQLQQPSELAEAKTVIIARGSNATGIAQKLEQEGIIKSALLFRIRYYMQHQPELKAGEYLFAPHLTLGEAISKMSAGDIVKRKFTIPEGRTVGEIVQILNAEQGLSGRIEPLPAEGSLLPDTYQFTLGDDRNSKIKEMQKAMTETLMTAWAQRDSETPLTGPQQLLTLASIVEKETGIDAERRRVAGVFINRLRKGMMLQSDPTVTYGITLGNRPLGRQLTANDLRTPTPYNTYTIPALPPGPIANPGKAAIMAAALPERNAYFYFVADGTGGHAFAETLDEHNRNVANWHKINK